MEPLIAFLCALAAAILFINYKSFNGRCSANDTEFPQAGIVVNFRESTVKIKRKVYPIGIIKSWSSESEYGKIVNASFAYIYLNDFKRSMHTITFVSPKAAEVFLHRLNLAIERCYEFQAQTNAAAAEYSVGEKAQRKGPRQSARGLFFGAV